MRAGRAARLRWLRPAKAHTKRTQQAHLPRAPEAEALGKVVVGIDKPAEQDAHMPSPAQGVWRCELAPVEERSGVWIASRLELAPA